MIILSSSATLCYVLCIPFRLCNVSVPPYNGRWTNLPTMKLVKISASQASSFPIEVTIGNIKRLIFDSSNSTMKAAKLKAAISISE